MIIKTSSNKFIWLFAIVVYLWKQLLVFGALSSIIWLFFEYYNIKLLGLKSAIPVGILGTALALFLSFRNNSAYDRWWEARKIWGGIVNYSRTFGIQVLTYILDKKTNDSKEIKTQLIYRHLGYINALRLTLREQNDEMREVLTPFFEPNELEVLLSKSNKPTQINLNQSQHLKEILSHNLIEDFRLYEFMHTLEELYTLQGKAERCLLYTSPSPRDRTRSRMPSSA